MMLLGNINAIPFRRRFGGGGGTPFPNIPGMIARWSAKGLTNEDMSTNPVWKDLTGNGHDLQMKNFGWAGMSGVGGYADNFSSKSWKKPSDRSDITWTSSSFNITRVMHMGVQMYYQAAREESESVIPEKRIIVKGLEDGQVLRYINNNNIIIEISQDGIHTIPSFIFKGVSSYHGYSLAKKQESCNVTVEILPLYPGFILGDGVDDFAVTENNLDLEDTYTIYTPLILLKYGGVVCGKNSDKDFSLNTVISSKSIGFYSANAWSGSIPVDLFEFVLVACKRSPQTMYVKDLITGKSNQSNSKEFVSNPGKYFIWRNTGGSWSQVAIAGQIICNGYYSTDEDDEKVLDWYKKQYPWLFFDQAWTVVGKTNEDEDRATIANITGNGNNLVLSNFGFVEDSGYGLYGENYNGGRWVQSTNRADLTWTSYSVNITSVKVASTQLYYQSYPKQPSFIVPSYKIKVYGLKDGQTLSYKQVTSEGQQLYKISEDGTYTLPSFPFKANGDWYGFTLNKVQESCDITIEQIPEYEGYLVTDGVDDKIISSNFKFGENYTVVGEWKFLQEDLNVVAGFLKNPNYWVLYNYKGGINTYIKADTQATFISGVHSIKAISSKGEVYPDFNSYVKIESGKGIETNNPLYIGFNPNVSSNNFTKLAFKNLAIYPTVLSKEDCIKAYNYLQTLKTK